VRALTKIGDRIPDLLKSNVTSAVVCAAGQPNVTGRFPQLRRVGSQRRSSEVERQSKMCVERFRDICELYP
jgi:hypothetical protein